MPEPIWLRCSYPGGSLSTASRGCRSKACGGFLHGRANHWSDRKNCGLRSAIVRWLDTETPSPRSRVPARQRLVLRAPLKSHKAEETESAFEQDAPPIEAAESSVPLNFRDRDSFAWRSESLEICSVTVAESCQTGVPWKNRSHALVQGVLFG